MDNRIQFSTPAVASRRTAAYSPVGQPQAEPQGPQEQVEISGAGKAQKATKAKKSGRGIFAKLVLGTLITASMALALAPPGHSHILNSKPPAAAEQVVDGSTMEAAMPFQLIREKGGDVVVVVQGNQVVNPAHQEAYRLNGAARQAADQVGGTLCEQAQALGGDCVDPILVRIPNGKHGTLEIEQTGEHSIWAGSTSIEREQGGVSVEGLKGGGEVFFFNDGTSGRY